jgi:hypothetical protein
MPCEIGWRPEGLSHEGLAKRCRVRAAHRCQGMWCASARYNSVPDHANRPQPANVVASRRSHDRRNVLGSAKTVCQRKLGERFMKALMKVCDFTIGIALVLLLAGASNGDESKIKHLRCTFSGTFVSGVENHLDTNGDRRSASVHHGLVDCDIGRFLFDEEFEFLDPLPTPVACPTGTTEFDLLQGQVVLTSEQTADQLFIEDAAGGVTFCLNPDLTFSFTDHGAIAGGTGRFREASGSINGRATGKYLVTGSKNGVFGGFGQFTETASGTLHTPR